MSLSPTSVLENLHSVVEEEQEQEEQQKQQQQKQQPAFQQSNNPLKLRTWEEVQHQSAILVQQTAHAKATYRSQCQTIQAQVNDADARIHALEVEWRKLQQVKHQRLRELDHIKLQRERTREQYTIRKLHLDILQFCLVDDPVVTSGGGGETKKGWLPKRSVVSSVQYWNETGEESTDELVVRRRRLEDVVKLFEAAQQMERSSMAPDAHRKAVEMKQDAIQKYIVFQQYNLV